MIFNVNLNKECNSIIPSKQCLPQIIVLKNFLEEFKDYVKNSIIYETIEFKIKFNEFPEIWLNHINFLCIIYIYQKKWENMVCRRKIFFLWRNKIHLIKKYLKSWWFFKDKRN